MLRIIGSVVLGVCGALFLLGAIAVLVQGHPAQLISVALAIGVLTGAWFLWPRKIKSSPGVAPSWPPPINRDDRSGADAGGVHGPGGGPGQAGLHIGPPSGTTPAFQRPAPAYPTEPAPGPRIAELPPVAVESAPELPPMRPGAPLSYAVGDIVPGTLRGDRFVAIDVETANASYESICAIGVAQVRDGVVTAQRAWLVRPPDGHGLFSAQNVRIHGITAEQVARNGQPWPAVLSEVLHMIGTDVVAAHNASFDINVVKAATTACGLPLPTFSYVDSLALARRVMPELDGHSLPMVAAACGVNQLSHHHAGDDARVCAEIIVQLLKLPQPAPVVRPVGGWESRGKSLPPNPDADPSHVLYGSSVTITGLLQSMTRTEARERLAELGATHRASVSKKTAYLVVGAPNGAELTSSGGDKLLRARALQADGHPVQIIDEREFLALLNAP